MNAFLSPKINVFHIRSTLNFNTDPTGHWYTSADGDWSRPGGCNGGIDGQEDVNYSVGTSIWSPDEDHHRQMNTENVVEKNLYYHPGVPMSLWDLTGRPTLGQASIR